MIDAWDYLTIPDSERGWLESLGRQGWELTAIGGDPADQRLYLKRRALTFRERVTLEQRSRYYAALGLAAPAADAASS